MSVRDNVAAGLKIGEGGMPNRAEVNDIVESALRRAALWDEVKDRLTSTRQRCRRQQQRLFIARAIATKPARPTARRATASLDR